MGLGAKRLIENCSSVLYTDARAGDRKRMRRSVRWTYGCDQDSGSCDGAVGGPGRARVC